MSNRSGLCDHRMAAAKPLAVLTGDDVGVAVLARVHRQVARPARGARGHLAAQRTHGFELPRQLQSDKCREGGV